MLRLGYVAAIFAVAAVGYKLGKRLGNNINKIAIFGGAACFSYLLYKTLKRRRQQTHNQLQFKKFDQLKEQHAKSLKQQINEDVINFQQKNKQYHAKLIKSISEIDYMKFKNSKQKMVVIGQISAGKSSILNLLLNLKLKYGVGQTTSELQPIYKNSNAQVYDAPGVNKQFDIFSSEVLKELFKMDTFIVCYQNCLSEVNLVIRVLSAISKQTKQKIYLVRTQCDRFNDSDALTIDEQLQVDRNHLKKMKETQKNFNYDYQILATSSRKSLSYRDNKKLQKILKQQQQKRQRIITCIWQ